MGTDLFDFESIGIYDFPLIVSNILIVRGGFEKIFWQHPVGYRFLQ